MLSFRKKLLSIISISLFLTIASKNLVYSQSESVESYEVAYQKYSASIEDYQSFHDDYILARAQYIRFSTQKSKTEAKDVTSQMLQARDQVVVNYIEVLKARLGSTPGVEQARRDSLNIRLDEEISWFQDHNSRIGSAGDLDDLVEDSDEAKEHFDATLPLFYEALANVSYGRVTDFRSRLDDILNESKGKLDEIRLEDDRNSFSIEKIQTLDRWVFESENLIARSRDKQNEADEVLTELSSDKRRVKKYINLYNEILTDLVDSQQLLKDATSYLGELIKEVKKEN